MGSPEKVPLIYVAAPYSGDPAMIAGRMAAFDATMASMLLGGKHPVSPLLFHALLGQHNVPGNWDFFERYSLGLLDRCDALLVIQLPGWESSIGVRGEIAHANARGIQSVYVGYDHDIYWRAVKTVLNQDYPEVAYMVSRTLIECDNDITKARDVLASAVNQKART